MDSVFWNISNLATDQIPPEKILIDQATSLKNLTNRVLEASLENSRLRSAISGFNMLTTFNICVPKLDDYTLPILYMFSNPEELYPVTISEETSDNYLPINGKTADNEEEFSIIIQGILSSPRITAIIQSLYNKAKSLRQPMIY